MSDPINRNLTIKLDDIAHLFVAPEFDPFSDQETELLGQPAFVYLVRKLGPDLMKKSQPISLTVQLPPEKITPDLKPRVEAALRRFCDVRRADNGAQLRILRSNGLRSLPSAIIALGLCLALSYLFLSNVLTFLSPAVNELLGQGFGIVSWVVLWHPVEAFLYDPIPLHRENSVLRYLATTNITIEPQPA
jgi:hypothetical protein